MRSSDGKVVVAPANVSTIGAARSRRHRGAALPPARNRLHRRWDARPPALGRPPVGAELPPAGDGPRGRPPAGARTPACVGPPARGVQASLPSSGAPSRLPLPPLRRPSSGDPASRSVQRCAGPQVPTSCCPPASRSVLTAHLNPLDDAWEVGKRNSGDDHKKKKYRLDKWSILSQPKDQGGLGFMIWVLRILLYLAKRDFFHFGSFKVKDGSQVHFWEDIWLGATPLRVQYPCLYNIARPKNITITDVLCYSPPNLAWRRDLVGPKLVAWNNLLPRIANITLLEEPDSFHWHLTKNGDVLGEIALPSFNSCGSSQLEKILWKIRAPLKVMIFLWYLRKGVLLTKDNLTKRNWHGNKGCSFCHNDETIEQLFF
ncbi:hypothetical protein U9M48_034358 [Paspalum notatum var. saurae]|uniref:Reverse transcriptase zinc-binding domain-containing protein n=1 Tax=Paspalum notatum var. saurae TaxID=547442 RepID=A0AAQ3UCK9_PASNO